MKTQDKSAKPGTSPSNQQREQAPRKEDNNPRQKRDQSIDKEIEKRARENRTPKGENL